MSTPNDSADPTPPPTPPAPIAPPRTPNAQDDALAALHQFASGETPDLPGNSDNVSPSASGFVGMLAKGPAADPEFAGPAPPTELPPLARPIPHASAAADSEFHPSPGTGEIHEAREVRSSPPPAPRAPTPSEGRAKPRLRRPPFWYKPALPVMFTLSSILFVIGIWACGAVIVWATGPATYASSERPSYPLMDGGMQETRQPDPNGEGYLYRVTPLFKTTSLIMLLCLPVAISLFLMAILMSRQVSAHDKR